MFHELTFGSVCSGIGSPEVAWHGLDWKSLWVSEIDKAASKVLAYRFPDVPNHGDMLLLADKVRRREIPAPDILVGGTPCQSFSVAGMHRGLDDPRGQLTIAFVGLANAIDEIRYADGLPPVIIVWENVPGVLTHKDNPFGCFLAGLAGEDDVLVPAGRKWTNAGAVFGPERAIAWRVLDAQYVGLAQRRRRVFVVASAREGFDPAAVLLEFDGVRRDSPPSREAGEGVTHSLAPCLTSSGRGVERTGDPRGQDAVVAVERPVGSVGIEPVPTWWDGRDVSQTLDAVLHKGQTMPEKNRFPAVLQPVAYDIKGGLAPNGRMVGTDTGHPLKASDHKDPQVICFSSKDHGADAQTDLAPTLRAGGHAESHANAGEPPAVCYGFTTEQTPKFNEDCALTLTKQSPSGGGQPQAVAYSVALRGREGGATAELGDDLAGCLRASTGGGDKPHVLAPVVTAFQTRGSNLYVDDHISGTIGTNCDRASGSSPMVSTTMAVLHPADVQCVTGSVTHTLKAEGFDASEDGTGRGQPIVCAESFSPTKASSGQQVDYAITYPTMMAVRRPMPVECERLQGFPDGWTLVPVGKNKDGSVKWAADVPRYKQLGNSMATTVMRWIGGRIAHHLATLRPGHNGGPPLYDCSDFADLLG